MECIRAFQSAMPRGVDVGSIYLPLLPLLHLLTEDSSQLLTIQNWTENPLA